MSKKRTEALDFDVEIGNHTGTELSSQKLEAIKTAATRQTSKRTPQQLLENRLAAIRFAMQQYASGPTSGKYIALETFLQSFLAEINMPLNRFAKAIGTTDSNLKKYLSGSRKFNAELALKFGYFFHVSPDVWLKVQLKNQLIELYTQKKQMTKYRQYDYRKFLNYENEKKPGKQKIGRVSLPALKY